MGRGFKHLGQDAEIGAGEVPRSGGRRGHGSGVRGGGGGSGGEGWLWCARGFTPLPVQSAMRGGVGERGDGMVVGDWGGWD